MKSEPECSVVWISASDGVPASAARESAAVDGGRVAGCCAAAPCGTAAAAAPAAVLFRNSRRLGEVFKIPPSLSAILQSYTPAILACAYNVSASDWQTCCQDGSRTTL